MKISLAFLTLIYLPFTGVSQNLSDAENKLYDNFKNYTEIMWTLENDQPCISNQAKWEFREGYGVVLVKTNNYTPFNESYTLLEYAADDTLSGRHELFFNGLYYKKNGYRFYYNENNQIVKMVSNQVRKQNYMKNGENVTAYYYTTTFDVSYQNGKIQTVQETRSVFKTPKKIAEAQSVVVRKVDISYNTDSVLRKKLTEQQIDEKDLTPEAPKETVSEHIYFENGDYEVAFYKSDGTVESKKHTAYNEWMLPVEETFTSFPDNGDRMETIDKYTYGSDKTKTTHTVQRFKNDQLLMRIEADYVAKTEYRFNANNELIFEKKDNLFRAKDEVTGTWSEWKDYKYCIN